jgi:hypothetical protein
MKEKMISLVCLLFAVIVTGCSTVEPGKHFGNTSLASMKTAFVVIGSDYNQAIGVNIHEALAQHGVTASMGTTAEKPKDVAFYVEYEDHWQWDMAMYLSSLDIRFIDNQTGQVVGSGAFREGAFHDFPDVKKKTFEVIESIYNAK